jgi:hypothetical protein
MARKKRAPTAAQDSSRVDVQTPAAATALLQPDAIGPAPRRDRFAWTDDDVGYLEIVKLSDD